MDIYWIQDHEQKGPLPEVEVISMLEAGLIPENARAFSGMRPASSMEMTSTSGRGPFCS